MTGRTIRLLIADDHEMVREGLRTLLSEETSLEIVGEAATGAEAVAMASAHTPHVILMDLVMPEMDGLEATRHIRAQVPGCQVIILSSFVDEAQVREAIQSGVIGYLLKDVLREDLCRAIVAAAQGRPTLHPEAQQYLMRQVKTPVERPLHDDLTEREMDVLRQIAQGRSNKEIAAALRLTEGTVKGYVSAILAKLDVADRTQAALYAVKHQLTES